MTGSRTRTSTAPERRLRDHPGAAPLTGLLAALLAATALACGPGGRSGDPGPFTLSVVNGSRHDATISWTGARQGGGTVGACEVETFTFDDGLWIVNVTGAADAAQFPMRVETGSGGPRTRTLALDEGGRINLNARIPLREPPCRIE